MQSRQGTGEGGDLASIGRALRRNWRLILAVTAISVVAAVAISLLRDSTYSAQAQLRFSTTDTQQILSQSPSPQAAEDAAAANAEYVIAPQVVNAVKRRLDSPLTPSELTDAIETRVQTGTNLVAIEAQADKPEGAADIANAFAFETQAFLTERQHDVFRRAADAVEKRRAEAEADGALPKGTAEIFAEQLIRLDTLARFSSPVNIVSQASVPGSPDRPGLVQSCLLALVLGLLLGSLAALVREFLRRGLASSDQLERSLQLPVAGHIPGNAMIRATGEDDGERAIEAHLDPFRILRANVAFLDSGGGPRVLGVTSAIAAEGKSTVAAGLAVAFAMGGARTVLVECNLRQPEQAAFLSLADAPGLSDYLSGNASLEETLQVGRLHGGPSEEDSAGADGAAAEISHDDATLVAEVACITAGTPSTGASELLRTERLRGLLASLREDYEVVILDCAPLLSVSDALDLLPHVDAALLCVRVGHTTEVQSELAKSLLERGGSYPVALVLTGVETAADSSRYTLHSSRHKAAGAKTEVPALADSPRLD